MKTKDFLWLVQSALMQWQRTGDDAEFPFDTHAEEFISTIAILNKRMNLQTDGLNNQKS